MSKVIGGLASICLFSLCTAARAEVPPARQQPPLGPPGALGTYQLEHSETSLPSMVTTLSIALGNTESHNGALHQWLALEGKKANGRQFRCWVLTREYPAAEIKSASRAIARYICEEGEPKEFKNAASGGAVLPSIGGWFHAWPRSISGGTPFLNSAPSGSSKDLSLFPAKALYLGQTYVRKEQADSSLPLVPGSPRVVLLQPDTWIGTASNTRQKDEKRRYDGSDYELVPLTRADYREMVEAGINCLHVDARQLPWVEDLDVFYWGIGGTDIPYPECLYRSSYLGPVLFLDEPGVVTRDYIVRPRLAKDPQFRKSVTPQFVFAAFEEHFRHTLQEGAPTQLLKGLAARPDLALGTINFPQENLFTWETIESTAAYELSQEPLVPTAIVWEPPGRVGTLRTLPELDMTYGCQLPVDDPKTMSEIIYGFLRGAARLTGKSWGTSIYGAVDRADAFWYLTHAYDLGASRFFFWDTAQQACVPYHECLALARNLRAHIENFPSRDLRQLLNRAEVAILLPAGYNLGHVHLGKGNLWGLGELNLERRNSKGVKYRSVMSNVFIEIERCVRLGVAFDLLWDLPQVQPSGYREIVRIREDGKIEVMENGKRKVWDQARTPERPGGIPPQLKVELEPSEGTAPLTLTAHASVLERSAPVFYTPGTDPRGIYQNAGVAWELYGPHDEDYRFLHPVPGDPGAARTNDTLLSALTFTMTVPGTYRLRAATVDMAGRSSITWKKIIVHNEK